MRANTSPTKPNLKTDQSGMASFLITMVLMIVITLIVLGFAQIARRNQREALDDQLSTQAFYAAETGVNLVQKLMTTTPSSQLKKTTCTPTTAVYSGVQLSDPTTNVYNTCLLVDNAPTSLAYDDVGINSTVAPLIPDSSGYGVGTLTLTWQPKSSSPTNNVTNCPTNTNVDKFTPSASWPAKCPVGVLRFDMVDTTAAGPTFTDQSLLNNTVTVFAPPATNHAPIVKYENKTAPGVSSLSFGTVQCTSGSTAQCSLTISGVQFNDTHYLRLISLYKDVALTSISGQTNSGLPVHFIGAQIMVDSTGKATDVLRRIQVRLDAYNDQAPSFAIESFAGICKQLVTDGSNTWSATPCP